MWYFYIIIFLISLGLLDNIENINTSPIVQEMPQKVNELAKLRLEEEFLANEKETFHLELENLIQHSQKIDKVRKEQIVALSQELEKVKDELIKAQHDLEMVDKIKQDSLTKKQDFGTLEDVIKSLSLGTLTDEIKSLHLETIVDKINSLNLGVLLSEIKSLKTMITDSLFEDEENLSNAEKKDEHFDRLIVIHLVSNYFLSLRFLIPLLIQFH